MIKIIFTILSICLLLTGCVKKYTYTEVSLTRNGFDISSKSINEKTITAKNDSDAYIQAYTSFIITQTINSKMNRTAGSNILDSISNFNLVNSDGVNIRYTIKLKNQPKLENAIRIDIINKTNNKTR